MRAFLSHSSKDKGFVERVADLLPTGTYELDSLTFDSGLVNSKAIEVALRRSDLFVLFLSENSVASAYVDFETLLGVEFLAKGHISKFLAICLDDTAFQSASASVRLFNVVRKSGTPESAARLVHGSLLAASTDAGAHTHPFVGRDDQLKELESQVFDVARGPVKALYFSGNAGAGRRTIARKFYQNQFPHVGVIFPEVVIDEFSGLEELYRRIITSLRPSLSAGEFRARATGFAVASNDEKLRQIAELLNAMLQAREAVFVVDAGGVLRDSGDFEPEIASLVGLLESKPHPPVVFISPRMIPYKFRLDLPHVAFVGVTSLDRNDAKRLTSRLLKEKGITPSVEQLEQLVELGDGHPYNYYRLSDEMAAKGLAAFLASPSDFLEWKRRNSSEYLSRVTLDELDGQVLGLLRLLPSLDFSAIVDALGIDSAKLSDSLLRLANLHVVEHQGDNFFVSPAVRIAVEKDARIGITGDLRSRALKEVAKSLEVRIDEGSAPLALVDSAILSAIEVGTSTSFTSALLLPSHYVWLAKRKYDERDFPEALRLSKEAVKGAGRLSSTGLVAACRFMCLAAARLNEQETFNQGIARLQTRANDNWARSNVAFLKGFNFRLQGNLPAAEEEFRASYDSAHGNISTARELAAICLARGNLPEAEKFAREALGYAPTNSFLLDILISVLVRKLGRSSGTDPEVSGMFAQLESVGREGGRSFYTTRRAEFEHLWGDNRKALQLIEEAIAATPFIFEPRRLQAEILLKDGNRSKAKDVIGWMREKINSRDNSDIRTNYRAYLETQAHYLTDVGQYRDAKAIYMDASVFTEREKEDAIRQIETAQAYAGKSGERP